MMVSTTAGGRPLKSATSRPGATHGGSLDLDAGAIWCRAPERGGPFSEEWPPGAEQLWRTQEGAHGDGQTKAWPRGQRWMVHHAGAGCAGSPRSAAVPPRTAGQSPRRCRRTALPGRWGRQESVLCRRPSSLPG